jgi:endonuclease I
MAFKYHDQGLEIFSRSGKILQQWHNEDPPTEAERHRNEQIHRLQGSRNIFIDEPEKLNQLIAQGFFY